MIWEKNIPQGEITGKISKETVDFAKKFGSHLGTNDTKLIEDKYGNKKEKTVRAKLTTTQLRKFYGEVKRQQMKGYNETDFVLLKPKLAYAVGRVKDPSAKINDLYKVVANAIDIVVNEDGIAKEIKFKNFIKIFEAIVAYHKAAEESNLSDNN